MNKRRQRKQIRDGARMGIKAIESILDDRRKTIESVNISVNNEIAQVPAQYIDELQDTGRGQLVITINFGPRAH